MTCSIISYKLFEIGNHPEIVACGVDVGEHAVAVGVHDLPCSVVGDAPNVELKLPVEGRMGPLRPGCAHRVMVKAGLGVL